MVRMGERRGNPATHHAPRQMNTTTSRSAEQAQAQLDEIQRLSDLLDAEPDDDELQDELRGLALSQEVRSCWQAVGEELEPTEWRLVLCTGGPHVEVKGDFDSAGDPMTAELFCGDWGSGLQSVPLSREEHDLLLWFAQSFYWGN